MEAAKIAQRVGIAIVNNLLAEAKAPIGVRYEEAEGVDLDYTLCSVFYIHMYNLRNLVNSPVDIWISIKYQLSEDGQENIGFTINHTKMPPCELKAYPISSLNYAVTVIKEFFAYSLLPYFDLTGKTSALNLQPLEGKYGKASSWGDTITLKMRAEDFPYDVDFRENLFKGFSKRMLAMMIRDVQRVLHTNDELKYRVFANNNDIGVVFMLKSTYEASKEIPRDL